MNECALMLSCILSGWGISRCQSEDGRLSPSAGSHDEHTMQERVDYTSLMLCDTHTYRIRECPTFQGIHRWYSKSSQNTAVRVASLIKSANELLVFQCVCSSPVPLIYVRTCSSRGCAISNNTLNLIDSSPACLSGAVGVSAVPSYHRV